MQIEIYETQIMNYKEKSRGLKISYGLIPKGNFLL